MLHHRVGVTDGQGDWWKEIGRIGLFENQREVCSLPHFRVEGELGKGLVAVGGGVGRCNVRSPR